MSISPAEQTKLDSRRLRGSLLESLADPVTAALQESDQSLIKYHGSYQQDNRDVREHRRLATLDTAHRLLIPTRTPAGLGPPPPRPNLTNRKDTRTGKN